MKIAIHIGDAKVGSTSIQHYLHRSRERLAARGVMVQHIAGQPPDHMALGRALVLAEPDPADTEVLDLLIKQVEDERPEWLILSSEAIWKNPNGAELLRQRVARLSQDIRLVAYLRDPVALFRSRMQQQVRFGPRIRSPLDWTPYYREQIERWESAFGDQLVLAPLQPSSLYRSHIGADLLNRIGLPVRDEDVDTDQRKNASECAEASSILQDYHLSNHPRGHRVLRPEASKLRKRLNRIAADRGIGTPVTLVDTIAPTILARTRDELRWMDEHAGIRFDAVPYDALDKLIPDDSLAGKNLIEHYCAVDPEVKQALAMAVLQDLLRGRSGQEAIRTMVPALPDRVAERAELTLLKRIRRALARIA